MIVAVAVAAAACMAVAPSASAAAARQAGAAQRLAASNPWGKAREVPGTAALNKGARAEILSVSCGSAGNCSAGGYYTTGYDQDGNPLSQAFVISEVHGTWQTAEEVPGPAVLKANKIAGTNSVSCASAGNCGAGGYYTSVRGSQEAFVVSEARGR